MATVSCLSTPDTERRLRRKRLAAVSLPSGERIPALRLGPSKVKHDVQLHEIKAEPDQPFILRESGCPYLEAALSDRRCLAGDTQPLSIEAQVRACLTADHERCPQFRRAEGLRVTTTLRLATYGICMTILAGLIVFAGFQAIQSAEAANVIAPVVSGNGPY